MKQSSPLTLLLLNRNIVMFALPYITLGRADCNLPTVSAVTCVCFENQKPSHPRLWLSKDTLYSPYPSRTYDVSEGGGGCPNQKSRPCEIPWLVAP